MVSLYCNIHQLLQDIMDITDIQYCAKVNGQSLSGLDSCKD